MTETDSSITRSYRGYNEKVIESITRSYNAGTRDDDAGSRSYDSITRSYDSITRRYKRKRDYDSRMRSVRGKEKV